MSRSYSLQTEAGYVCRFRPYPQLLYCVWTE